MTKNRVEEHTNGNGTKTAEAKPPEKPTTAEHRRPVTDLDEVSIRLWNAYNLLAQREEEVAFLTNALCQERKQSYLNGQMDLRSKFKMPPSPKIEEKDGVRELVWVEQAESKE